MLKWKCTISWSTERIPGAQEKLGKAVHREKDLLPSLVEGKQGGYVATLMLDDWRSSGLRQGRAVAPRVGRSLSRTARGFPPYRKSRLSTTVRCDSSESGPGRSSAVAMSLLTREEDKSSAL